MKIKTIKERIKPIFHWKLGSHLVPNANKIDTNNMKSTWPTRAPTRGNPSPPIFHQLTLGLALGDCDLCWVHCDLRWVNCDSCWVCKVFQIPTCRFRQRESLALGGLPNAWIQCEGVCVAVEYIDSNPTQCRTV